MTACEPLSINGIQEVSGSIPLISTIKTETFLKRKWLGMKIPSHFRYYYAQFQKSDFSPFCRSCGIRVEWR